MTNNLTIYSAGPLDLGQDIPNWRARLVESLAYIGHTGVVFDPSTAYKQSLWGTPDLSRSRFIENVNRMALMEAQFFVVCLPRGVPTIGTPIEINMAYEAAKEIYILTDILYGSSVYLDNRIPPENWITLFSTDAKSIKTAVTELAVRMVQGIEDRGLKGKVS